MQVYLAEIYAYQKKTDKALALFRKGISGSAHDPGIFYWYAEALKDAGNLTEAENNSRRAVQLDSKGIDAHKLLAETLALEGKKDEAAAEQQRVEELGANAAANSSSK
jgi:predicted Zn-dependent protease